MSEEGRIVKAIKRIIRNWDRGDLTDKEALIMMREVVTEPAGAEGNKP